MIDSTDTYDEWLTLQIQETLSDSRPSIPHEQALMEWENEKEVLQSQLNNDQVSGDA